MNDSEQQVAARFGSPFESDGTCEGCDRQPAAVWLVPDGAPGFNDLLFCADCILKGEVE